MEVEVEVAKVKEEEESEIFVSMADVESLSSPVLREDKDVDDKGRKFETTMDATWDMEVKPVELLISFAVATETAGDIEYVVNGGGDGGAVCNLSSNLGNKTVLL